MCQNCGQETHEQYVARINKIVERSGEDRTLDGLPVRRNSVLEAQRVMIRRQYGKK